MADLRGRYVMPGRIISFGVVMSTTWTNSKGDSISASANMTVNSSTITPQFYVTTTSTTGTGTTPNTGTGTVVGGAGLGSGQGVTQSVRAAGDGNTASNGVDIDVTKNGLAAANIVQSGKALVAGETITGESGAGQVSVSAKNGGLQMAVLASNNQGNVLQQIGGGSVNQSTLITGDLNTITNLTRISVVMGNNNLNNITHSLNLDQLKGLRTAGY